MKPEDRELLRQRDTGSAGERRTRVAEPPPVVRVGPVTVEQPGTGNDPSSQPVKAWRAVRIILMVAGVILGVCFGAAWVGSQQALSQWTEQEVNLYFQVASTVRALYAIGFTLSVVLFGVGFLVRPRSLRDPSDIE